MQGNFILSELSTGWLDSYWTVYWLSWMLLNCHRLYSWTVCRCDFTLAELSIGWLDSGWTWRFDCSWAVFSVTLLLEYFGECTIRVTVLLEYLDHAFSICGCLLFYNSLIFNPILLSFGRGSFLCLVHLHSNFQLISLCSLCDIRPGYSWFLIDHVRHLNFDRGFIKHGL